MWINDDDYLNHYLISRIENLQRDEIDIVTYNRENYDVLTDYILNQDQSDMCPMEKRVKDLKEAEEAFAALKPIFIKE